MISKSAILRKLFQTKPIIRIVGAHNGLGARLIERNGFDGVWASGLEISTGYAVPDANLLTMTDNLHAAQAMNEATSLPVVCDCDTGYGNASNVIYMVKKYEAAGLAAAVIEDKLFPKVNSFVPGRQELVTLEEFAGKIEAAKKAQKDPDFMVIARIEALIAGWGLDEAFRRANAYADAGSDAILVHSNSKTPDEIYAFSEKWKRPVPLVAIPTIYYHVTADELAKHGFKMAIYANHGLRAAIRAMDEVFKTIYRTGSTAAVEDRIVSLQEVFEIQGMMAMKEDEKKFLKREKLQAVILAVRDHLAEPKLRDYLKDLPHGMLDIDGKTLIDRQMAILRSAGVTDICIVGGNHCEKLKAEVASILQDRDHATAGSAHALMAAQDQFKHKSVVVFSDILFDRQIVDRLAKSPHQITLVMDRAYQYAGHRKKNGDLISVEDSARSNSRILDLHSFKTIRKIGKKIPEGEASFEFIGMAFFREEGLRDLAKAWDEAQVKFKGRPFYEAPGVKQAGVMDLIQYLIDRGTPVHGMEIEHGWSEIHTFDDYERAKAYVRKSERVISGKV